MKTLPEPLRKHLENRYNYANVIISLADYIYKGRQGEYVIPHTVQVDEQGKVLNPANIIHPK